MASLRSSAGNRRHAAMICRYVRAAGPWLLTPLCASVLAVACSDDASEPVDSAGGTGSALGGAMHSGGVASGGIDAKAGDGSMNDAAGTGPQGGAGGHPEAGAGGHPEAGAGGHPEAGAGDAGQGGLGGEGGAAHASCSAELEAVPLGTYAVDLTSVAKVCLVSDLSCTPDSTRSGSGQGTLTLSKSGEDGNLTYIDGALQTPTVDLDGLGRHSETYSGMLVDAGGGFEAGWDTTSTAGSIILWGDSCFGEDGKVGKTLVTLERASGNITSFARHCETQFATFWYDVTISGTGTLVCD
jgi:hypothetical protein